LNVKTPKKFQSSSAGNALVMTMIMTAVALVLLAGIMSWSAGNARLAARSNEYTRALAAAEAATEKVNSRMASDYLSSGEAQVIANLSSYRAMVPTGSDSSYWTNWEFSDAQGNVGSTYVQQGAVSNYQVLTGAYAGLTGFASTYSVVSDAREPVMPQNVVAGVLEAIQLTRIPIFQFAMYSSGEMEVSCGNPFVVNGPVHSNGQLYVEPDNLLTFQSGVTAVGNVVFGRDPLDTRGAPGGAVTYQITQNNPASGQPALTLPIGVTNTPQAVREIIEPPQPFELASSAIGRSRYYWQSDLVITVVNTNISVTGGYSTGGTPVPSNQMALFVSTNSTFIDSREHKTVCPIDINVGAFVTWCTSTNVTNMNLRASLGRDIASIYIWDQRTLPSTSLGAVRVSNGQQLPPLGLTVATGDPLYVLGHYNQPVTANLGTTNVSTTLPASLVGDAVTILSTNWSDGSSGNPESSRVAGATTVNAAILAGEVDTTAGHYSGGMENFPRFLENWGSGNIFTYNGSMIKMFPSLYATNVWGQTNVYTPPSRNWTYDTNFNIPTLLPPLTPSLQVVSRSQWAALAPNQTSAP
jgi:hypothetical protein